ncbi:hypothetical protein ABT352_33075 [Streptosporangium sp. NPDC000563]|uniref:hypothetical protein n=1 Tax=Streptosporangium sp. NPDC000563 TaxID=3154366 RepID=UPI0033165881
MLETRPIDLSKLGEDLNLAVATAEMTADQAVNFILHLCGPEMTPQEARRIYRNGDATQMACEWKIHPTSGNLMPLYGPPRRLWDRLHGKDRNIPVIPEIATTYPDITNFTT